MAGAHSSKSPLETVTETVGERTTEAFKILGNETRLAILLALWDAYQPFEADHEIPFSVLRKRVGIRDKGQFYYHLDKLEGHFVRKTDGGYELSGAGHQFVRTIIAGAGIEDRSLAPTAVEWDCYLCGGPTLVTYHDEWLFWVCADCDGLRAHDAFPEGILAGGAFNPAGFTGRQPEEVLNAAWTGGLLQSGLGGVCDACSGPMDGWLHVCEDHTTDGCPACGWRDAAVARFRCAVCKHHHQMVPWWLVINHPVVVTFYYERGVPLQYEDGVTFQPRIELNLQAHHDQELVSVDPPRVRVTIQYAGDELQLLLDEGLNVIDASGRE